ncbi:MAG: ligase-associated DNA damage response DEXH box helicase [Phycisphaerae bacterium]|nr:ligase-associated DNA damage response DEXH box helicase [Phycisphaerae bacterium]
MIAAAAPIPDPAVTTRDVPSTRAARDRIVKWFGSRGWSPFPFQHRTWEAYRSGRSGLIHAPTGMGKTLAAWLGPVEEYLDERGPPRYGAERVTWRDRKASAAFRVLWITPMRALASDTTKSLSDSVSELGLDWSVEKRTGDTASSVKIRQKERLPTALVTTPESLSLLLSYPDAAERFSSLRCVIVDEWHELLSTKRGTQTELCLARLRGWRRDLRTWGLSATLGNLDEAARSLVGADAENPVLIRGDVSKRIVVKTILPESTERFPWAGHLGLRLLSPVLDAIEESRASLLFTNTRSQAELWYRAIFEARPDWIGRIAIHHGSLDREVRAEVEDLLRRGELRCVVCTSILDIGVDFSPDEQVNQVGSPKGVARLLQRAGRSGHQPGAASTVVCVPTNALELIEFAAAREAMAGGEIEPRTPIEKPLDVLVQHLVTAALGGGFEIGAMEREVRSTWAFRGLSREEWEWCVDFVTRGGRTLGAYPRFARVRIEGSRVAGTTGAIERMHRLNIGTITSDASIRVKYVGGATIGTIEESFIARLAPGDRFVLGGKPLELVRVRDMTAQVKRAATLRGAVPRWEGGRSPLSTHLSRAVRRLLGLGSGERAEAQAPEMRAVEPLLDLQSRWSRLPEPDELLIEWLETDAGFHLFVYPFEGRLVHEGIGALAAHRLTRHSPRSITVSANDYGIELLCAEAWPGDEASWRAVLSVENLLDDLLSCLNTSELTRRQFRDIARVAGLIVPGFPGSGKSVRQVQASSGLFFDVFAEFDPGNLLLEQARREVMEQQLEAGRMRGSLTRLASQRWTIVKLDRLSPLAFPLWAEGLRTQHVSSESWATRVKKMALSLETKARLTADTEAKTGRGSCARRRAGN